MSKTDRTCPNCRYFHKYKERRAAYIGECRKNAPRLTTDESELDGWPGICYADDWCGEWEEKP